ncbi:MAG: hypothetical protein IJU31_05205 [Synergistaceae bacterium]|nr:hypothetical protein [Synergistaceae bacterium]
MKKFFALALVFVLSAGCACADPKVTFNVYKCLVCDKLFQSFPGDNLDAKDFRDKEQLRRVFRFTDRGKNLQECKNGFKSHVFEKKGSNTTGFSSLANSGLKDITAVIRDGGSLNSIKLTEWECLYCKKHFYSLNDENLNIRDWELQTSFLYNMKGQAIPKCSYPETWGHIFVQKKTGSVKSYELATIVYDLYWVKN